MVSGLFEDLSALNCNLLAVVLKFLLEFWGCEDLAQLHFVQMNLHFFKLDLVCVESFLAFLERKQMN
jgi:hypothetical protein